MTKKISTIYALVEYANSNHLKHNRTQTDDEYFINYNENGVRVELKETNSLVEDEYCLSLESARYIVESIKDDAKKSMIHHHKKRHKFKHLQFKLYTQKEEIKNLKFRPEGRGIKPDKISVEISNKNISRFEG